MKLAEILEKMMDRKLSDAHFCLPAEVVSYESAKQMASVKPLLKQRTVDGVDNNLPIINNVPVFMPRASDFFIHIPIKVGDKVTLFFTDYSIDTWLQDGNYSTDTDVRNHSLNDAFAVPMTNYWSSPISGADADDFVITNGSLEAEFKKNGTLAITGNVTVTGTLTATVDCIGGGKSLKSHTHSGTSLLVDMTPARVTGSTGTPS